MALTHSTEEMFANLEYAANSNSRLSGRADAVANVGRLLTGQYTEEQLKSVHDEVLDERSDAAYVKGYTEAWDVLFNLVYGVEPKNLANQLGNFPTK